MQPLPGRLRNLSRRDARVAGITVVLLAATAVAVVAFFPQRKTAQLEVTALWPGRAEQLLGPLSEVPAYQRGHVLVELRHFTPETAANVRVDDTPAGAISVDASGEGRARVTLPAAVQAGEHQLFVTDAGTGNDAPAVRVAVLRERPASVWAGPRPLPQHAALLVATGFTPGSVVTLRLLDAGASPVELGEAKARHDGRFSLLVGIPASVPKGPHRLVARDAAGRSAVATLVLGHA